MRQLYVVAALAVVMAACSSSVGGGNSASGSLAVSRNDSLLYAADSDLDTLFVVNANTQQVLQAVKVGRQPEKVLVAPDDTVYVTNRMGRSVSVLRPGDTQESSRIDVGVEPVGLAISADGRTLFVVNSTSLTTTEVGTVMAIDTASQQTKWELPVGLEPRAIGLVSSSRALVTLYKTGDVVLIDTVKGVVLKGSTDVFTQLNRAALGLETNTTTPAQRPMPEPMMGGQGTARPRGLEAMAVSPDGKQVYIASRIASDATLPSREDATLPFTSTGSSTNSGGGYASSTCGASAVTAPSIVTFGSDATPQVDDVTACAIDPAVDRPPMIIISDLPTTPIQGPSALAQDPTGTFLFIANRESNNVAIVPTTGRDQQPAGSREPPPVGSTLNTKPFGPMGNVTQVVSVGAGPSGVAVSSDGVKAWVFNAFDHSITSLSRVGDQVSATTTVKLADDVLPADVVAGRKLFFSAVDGRMNNPSTGIACASCHFEGREDGHVWNFTDGPRQTPSLAGRMVAKTAPYHWSGEFPDLLTFMSHTVQQRMGGTGVTPQMEQQVAAYLQSLPAADNPHRDTTPADVVARGRAAFEKAGCQSCHEGEAFTNNGFASVGTLVMSGAVRDDTMFLQKGFNVPSLLGVARTAPYLHDGSVTTLKQRILDGKNGNLHGATSVLADSEVDDLVAYLKTL